MHPASDRSRNLVRALIAAAFMVAFAPSTAGLAQNNEQQPEAASAATPADQPRRGRERRRAAEAAAESPGAEAQAAATPAPGAIAEPAEPRVRCKSIKQAGTKIARRVCGTPEEWASVQRQTATEVQGVIQEIRDKSSFPAPPEVPVAIPP